MRILAIADVESEYLWDYFEKSKLDLHGHIHLSYGQQYKRHDQYQKTHIINAYERCFFEYEEKAP